MGNRDPLTVSLCFEYVSLGEPLVASNFFARGPKGSERVVCMFVFVSLITSFCLFFPLRSVLFSFFLGEQNSVFSDSREHERRTDRERNEETPYLFTLSASFDHFFSSFSVAYHFVLLG